MGIFSASEISRAPARFPGSRDARNVIARIAYSVERENNILMDLVLHYYFSVKNIYRLGMCATPKRLIVLNDRGAHLLQPLAGKLTSFPTQEKEFDAFNKPL